jgi:hypothetical protein
MGQTPEIRYVSPELDRILSELLPQPAQHARIRKSLLKFVENEIALAAPNHAIEEISENAVRDETLIAMYIASEFKFKRDEALFSLKQRLSLYEGIVTRIKSVLE